VNEEETTSRRAATSFRAAVALVFVVGIFALWKLPPWLPSPYDDLAKHLGEALIIASVLAVPIDLYAKNIMLREVTRDVFHYITGHPLPSLLQDRIRQLVSINLVSKDMRVRYNFSWYEGLERSEDGSGLVLVTIETESRLENLSASDILHRQHLELEAHFAPRVLSLRCMSSEGDACYDLRPSLGGGNLAKPDTSNPRMLVAQGNPIKIRPNLDIPAISYLMTSKYECLYPCDYSDVFSFLGPPSGSRWKSQRPRI
jgi:hypothetical protein